MRKLRDKIKHVEGEVSARIELKHVQKNRPEFR